MFAPSHTLLLITQRVLARVDFSGKRQLAIRDVWVAPANAATSMAALATAALQLGPRRAGRVWILNSEFWTGTINLPSDVSSFLGQQELEQALALEAEIDSGISAFASHIAATPLPSSTENESCWCTTQISTSDAQCLVDALQGCGGRMAGMAHPAAHQFATATEADPSTDFNQLLRHWDDSFAEQTSGEAEGSHEAVTSLAKLWANTLASTTASVPVIRLAPGTMSKRQLCLASAAAGVVSLAACCVWYQQTQSRLTATDRAITALQERLSAHESTQRNLQSLDTKVSKLRKEAATADAQRRTLEQNLLRADRTHALENRRWLVLLDGIASSIDNACWIQQLEPKPMQATVHGLAVDNAAAHRFASALENALQATGGWSVLPAETRAGGHNLVAFRIVLEAKEGAQSDAESVATLSALNTTSSVATHRSLDSRSKESAP